jgi:hypothetical protein
MWLGRMLRWRFQSATPGIAPSADVGGGYNGPLRGMASLAFFPFVQRLGS